MSIANLILGNEKKFQNLDITSLKLSSGSDNDTVISKFKEYSGNYTMIAGTNSLTNQKLHITQINNVVYLKLNNNASVFAGGSTPYVSILDAIPSDFLPSNDIASMNLGVAMHSNGATREFGVSSMITATGEIRIYKNVSYLAWADTNQINWVFGLTFTYDLRNL